MLFLPLVHAWGGVCQVVDSFGCCEPYFFCGSNGRCTRRSDVCESATAELPECVLRTASASFALSRLKIKHRGNYNTKNIHFNICGNAEMPSGCTRPSPAYAVDGSCEALASSVYKKSGLATLLDDDPTEGVRIEYSGGDPCGHGNRSFVVDAKCRGDAVEPTNVRVLADDCAVHVSLEAAAACPVECARGLGGAVCSNRGECVVSDNGVRCDCDRGRVGAACETTPATPTDLPTWKWQAFAALLVTLAAATAIYRRCRDIRHHRVLEVDAAKRKFRFGKYRAVDSDDDEVAGLELHASPAADMS